MSAPERSEGRVFVPFLYELRSRKVPVGPQEAVALARALAAGLHQSSIDGFYHVARSLLVHREAHLDAFDEAFLAVFKGIEGESKKLRDELWEWLEDAQRRMRELTDEERAFLASLDPAELERMFEERLRQQRERHDGGNFWIGTGGTSPFGNAGEAPQGIRVGGAGGMRSAMKTADARMYRPYRNDLTLDIRQLGMALRKLRAFAREGAEEELDLEGTIDATAKNAGELEVVVRPPRRPNTRVILLMDVGGSMDPYADLVSRLFSAASKATHFKELRSYYFHNCIYGRLFKTAGLQEPVPAMEVLHECGPHYKVILVGDAWMAPYELWQVGGGLDLGGPAKMPGIGWLVKLAEHFPRSVWMNPEHPRHWTADTISAIRQIFPMYPLTIEGIGEAVTHLIKNSPGFGVARS